MILALLVLAQVQPLNLNQLRQIAQRLVAVAGQVHHRHHRLAEAFAHLGAKLLNFRKHFGAGLGWAGVWPFSWASSVIATGAVGWVMSGPPVRARVREIGEGLQDRSVGG